MSASVARHRVTERRMSLERPHAREHAESVVRRSALPRDLLAWFLEGYRSEMPDAIHASDVWRDTRRRGDPDGYQPVGGSLLGTPRTEEGFRRLIEEDAFAFEVAEFEGHKDRDVHYATPMRAALARLAGRGRDSDPRVFMARVLYRIAHLDGDWDAACASFGIIEPVRPIYIEKALYELWRRFETGPRQRVYGGAVA